MKSVISRVIIDLDGSCMVCKTNFMKEYRGGGDEGWKRKREKVLRSLLRKKGLVLDLATLVALPRIFGIRNLMAQSTIVASCSGNSMCGPWGNRSKRARERDGKEHQEDHEIFFLLMASTSEYQELISIRPCGDQNETRRREPKRVMFINKDNRCFLALCSSYKTHLFSLSLSFCCSLLKTLQTRLRRLFLDGTESRERDEKRRNDDASWTRATLMHECNVTCRSPPGFKLISTYKYIYVFTVYSINTYIQSKFFINRCSEGKSFQSPIATILLQDPLRSETPNKRMDQNKYRNKARPCEELNISILDPCRRKKL